MPKHDLVIIGAGPGGYVAAIRAAQLGMDVACVEKEKALGGTCLRVGCIPSKALLESSERYYEAKNHFKEHGIKADNLEIDIKAFMKRKDKVVNALTKGVAGLFKKNKVTSYTGTAVIKGAGKVVVQGDEEQEIEADNILIATGSASAPLKGVEVDGENIMTSSEALSMKEIPKKLVVIGAGYIGLEMGSVWNRLGTEVTFLEYLDRVLPGMDSELAEEGHKAFKKQGMNFELGQKVTAAKYKDGECVVEREGGDPVKADKVLLAVGRVPHVEGLGLDEAGIELTDKGRIKVDEHYKTSVDGIYAIGDVIGGAMLAHKAEEEGVACVEHLAGEPGHVNYDVIPAVVYTHPEIASVGKTEDQLKDDGVEYNKGSFPFLANGRAKSLNDTTGWVKILADKKTDRVLGVHIIGPRAGDLIAEAAAAMEFGASSEDIARTCHAHPTLAESVKEAAFAVHGRTIHF